MEKDFSHGDGNAAGVEMYLPDNGYQRERIDYSYDSAGRVKTMQFAQPGYAEPLYQAQQIDVFGRVRTAKLGGAIDYSGSYADVGRRLVQEARISGASGSRRYVYANYDPMAREQTRQEYRDSAAASTTELAYDTLGRLSAERKVEQGVPIARWSYRYDPLGNLTGLVDAVGNGGAALSYGDIDRDRVCRVGYGHGGLAGTACNLSYDAPGNTTEQPTRTGTRKLEYFASGMVRAIADNGSHAEFRYDPFGALQSLDVTSPTNDARHDRHYGLFEQRRLVSGGFDKTVLYRHLALPDGWTASKLGAKASWLFAYDDGRGGRSYLDEKAAFVQDIDYQPFGEAKSTGAQLGSAAYSTDQWNGGDALASMGLVQLGTRLYDPVIGRFLNRDPVRMLRTAATSNPYAFALNDPWNRSDPTGADPDFGGCIGKECQGPTTDNFPPGGGPSQTNPFSLYFPSGVRAQSSFAKVSPFVPPPAATFSNAPKGPVTAAGEALARYAAAQGILMGDNFGFDALAATGISKEAALESLANTPEAHIEFDAYNASLESSSSFFAGFGDTVWAWCPGCGHQFRSAMNINSGEGDQFAYAIGSLTGVVALVVAPNPISAARACFVAGTLVQTESGSRAIESVQVGDLVWAEDTGNGERSLQRVAHTFTTRQQVTVSVRYRTPDGRFESLQVTPQHPFWTERGWVGAQELTAGDRLLELSQVWAEVVAVQGLGSIRDVFNLEVEGVHTYFVGRDGVLVHNECVLARARREIAALPQGLFERGACQECAEVMMNALKRVGIQGDLLTITSKRGAYIVSDLISSTSSITSNGMHYAVRVGDVVFDNLISREGVAYDAYVKSLHAREGLTIAASPF